MDIEECCWRTSQVYIAAGSAVRDERCLFTLNRSILRPPHWFTAVWFGVLVCIARSANSVVRCTPFDACLSTCLPPSVSLLRAAELRRGERKRQTFVIEASTSVHPSTCQESHYHCKPVRQQALGKTTRILSASFRRGISWDLMDACELQAPAQQRPRLALILKTGI